LVDVICDTSFLMQLTSQKIKNISQFEIEIGNIQFVIPEAVINELENLSTNSKKNQNVLATLNYIQNFKKFSIKGKDVDNAIIEFVRKNGGFVATLDKDLKKQIKNFGGSVISLSNNRIILETK